MSDEHGVGRYGDVVDGTDSIVVFVDGDFEMRCVGREALGCCRGYLYPSRHRIQMDHESPRYVHISEGLPILPG